jgi:excisionase family DNA binding protein
MTTKRDLMTPAEVSATFRVHPKTVTRWAEAGRLQVIRTLGGHRRFWKDEIEAILSGEGQAEVEAAAAEQAAASSRPYVIPQRDGLAGQTWTIERLPRDVEILSTHKGARAGALAVIQRTDGAFKAVAAVAPDDEVPVAHMEGMAAALADIFGGEVAEVRIGGER